MDVLLAVAILLFFGTFGAGLAIRDLPYPFRWRVVGVLLRFGSYAVVVILALFIPADLSLSAALPLLLGCFLASFVGMYVAERYAKKHLHP